jgi:hypothetical protein
MKCLRTGYEGHGIVVLETLQAAGLRRHRSSVGEKGLDDSSDPARQLLGHFVQNPDP